MGKNKKNITKVKVEEVNEADKLKTMISDMAKVVKNDSIWYIISMNWINKWQQFIGFDGEPDSKSHPGKMDNSDII